MEKIKVDPEQVMEFWDIILKIHSGIYGGSDSEYWAYTYTHYGCVVWQIYILE